MIQQLLLLLALPSLAAAAGLPAHCRVAIAKGIPGLPADGCANDGQPRVLCSQTDCSDLGDTGVDMKGANGIDNCGGACVAKGNFRYMGVEFGSQCFCANEVKLLVKGPPASPCNSPCQKGGGMCGGNVVINIYEIFCDNEFGKPDSDGVYNWGFVLIGVLVGVIALYGGGWVGFLAKTQGAELAPSSHPHYALWTDTAPGLVVDGVKFAKERVGSLRSGGGRYEAVGAAEKAHQSPKTKEQKKEEEAEEEGGGIASGTDSGTDDGD